MTPQQTNERLDAIAATLDADPLPARLALLELVGALAQADRGLLYCVVMREGRPYYVDLQAFGPPDFVAASLANEGVCILDMGRPLPGHEPRNRPLPPEGHLRALRCVHPRGVDEGDQGLTPSSLGAGRRPTTINAIHLLR